MLGTARLWSGCAASLAVTCSLCAYCVGLCLVSPGWANSDEPPERPGRFRLWHDLGDMLNMTWGAPGGLYTLLPDLCRASGGAHRRGSFADDEVQAVFAGNDEDDALARAGTTYAIAYFGPVQAGLYVAGELLGDPKLSAPARKPWPLLRTTAVIQPLKLLTRRRHPDSSDRRSFPSFDAGAVSSIILPCMPSTALSRPPLLPPRPRSWSPVSMATSTISAMC